MIVVLINDLNSTINVTFVGFLKDYEIPVIFQYWFVGAATSKRHYHDCTQSRQHEGNIRKFF